MSLKWQCTKTEDGYYLMDQGVQIPVRIFMNDKLFHESEEGLYAQIKAATECPDVRDVVITLDVHTEDVVPFGSVIVTEQRLRQAHVGYDISCGMLAFRSD